MFYALHVDFEICAKQLLSFVLYNINLSYPKTCKQCVTFVFLVVFSPGLQAETS